jgi:hypothetical protein
LAKNRICEDKIQKNGVVTHAYLFEYALDSGAIKKETLNRQKKHRHDRTDRNKMKKKTKISMSLFKRTIYLSDRLSSEELQRKELWLILNSVPIIREDKHDTMYSHLIFKYKMYNMVQSALKLVEGRFPEQ